MVIYQILFIFITYCFWHIVLIYAIIAFLNAKINVKIYIHLFIRDYENLSKITVLLKTL